MHGWDDDSRKEANQDADEWEREWAQDEDDDPNFEHERNYHRSLGV